MTTHRLVMWQIVPLASEQSHLMPGLRLGPSMSVESMAAPVHGSPLVFQLVAESDEEILHC